MVYFFAVVTAFGHLAETSILSEWGIEPKEWLSRLRPEREALAGRLAHLLGARFPGSDKEGQNYKFPPVPCSTSLRRLL